MRNIAIIQARTGSTRLPNKVLLDLRGKTVLERVINRVLSCRSISETLVATTNLEEDLRIVGVCREKGVKFYCGSEQDVLDRYYQAARNLGADTDNVIRITADCPLIDPTIIDAVIDYHLKQGADYTSNTLKETYPDGEDVEVFRKNVLEQTWQEATLLSEREHVTPYIKKNPNKFKLANYEAGEDWSSERWTLDSVEDYAFIRFIYEHLEPVKGELFGMMEILAFLRQHPEIKKLNSHIQRNEGYFKSLEEDQKIGGA